MHQIAEVVATPLSYVLPEGSTVRMGIGSTRKRDTIIVRVTTDEGLVGYGEAHPGRSPGAIVSLIRSTLAPLVVGMEATDVHGVWHRIYRMQLASHGLGAGAALALSGIDMALWDLRGKAAGMPVHRLLGGSARRVKAYAGGIALGYQPAESLAEEAAGYVARGYRAVKLRIGDGVRNDIERVAHVRKVLGDDIEILTDANTAYTMADVRRVLPAFAELDVGWLEEPFACTNFGAYREAARLDRRVPIAAGENHYTRYEFAQLIEAGAVQEYQPDLSKTGGISEGMRIAGMVSAWGARVHPHSSATGLNHSACIQFLAAVDNPGYFEACVSRFNPLRDLFGPVFEIGADGCVAPLEAPGLGLTVDERVFKDFPVVDGPGYV